MLSFADIVSWPEERIGTPVRALEAIAIWHGERVLYPLGAATTLTRGRGGAVVRKARGGAPMPTKSSEVLVGRRYRERGFLDAAMKLFIRNPPIVEPEDWTRLAERLMERSRIPDVVSVCETGGVPLPRERMLARADEHLRRKDVDTT